MATITVKVQANQVREDSKKRVYVHTQDVETNQFFTIYAKKGVELNLGSLKGKTAVVRGTVHAFPPNDKGEMGLKVVAREIDLVK